MKGVEAGSDGGIAAACREERSAVYCRGSVWRRHRRHGVKSACSIVARWSVAATVAAVSSPGSIFALPAGTATPPADKIAMAREAAASAPASIACAVLRSVKNVRRREARFILRLCVCVATMRPGEIRARGAGSVLNNIEAALHSGCRCRTPHHVG